MQLYMVLLTIIFAVFILIIIPGGESFEAAEAAQISPLSAVFVFVCVLFFIAHIIPSLALSVRRFHDLGQTGWLVLVFILLSAIPIIGSLGSLAQIIWFCFRGTVGPNQYGPDPLGGSGDFQL